MASKPLRYFAAAVLLAAAQAAYAILPIEHWETSRGARVYFVQNRDLPMLDVSVDFAAGAAFDAAGKPGVASMTNRMLRLGARGLDEDDIARGLADIGANLSGRFDSDRAGLGLRTLSSVKERTRALDIFARLLNEPVFPASVLEREKVTLIGALKDADTRPDTIVRRTFGRLVYPAHPYGRRGAGEVDTVAKLSRDDLAAFHRANYTPRRATIAMIGDVSRAEAEKIAEALTAKLAASDKPAPQLPEVAALAAPVVRWVEHPSSQSHILMGAPGISRNDSDYFALFVGNHVLGGGGFQSRISDEVRQKRGLAYSAYSAFSPMLREGPFVVGMQTHGEQAKEALEVVRRTLADFIAKGPTPQELAAAKANIIGGFPLRIDNNRKIHDHIAMIGFFGLPLDYLDQFVKNVERVGVEQVRDAFRRRVDPERMVTVVVGPQAERAAAAPNR